MRTTLFFCLLAVGAWAQTPVYTLSLATNGVPAASTNSTAGTNAAAAVSYYQIDTLKQPNVTVLLSGSSPSTTNATAFTFGLNWSLDATNWYTLPELRVPLTMNGATTATAATNLDCSWFRYLKVGTLENVGELSTNNVTNIVVNYFFK